MLPELMDHRQHGNPGKGAQAPILRHGARAAVLRRQHREGETERDRPPEQVLPCITGGCATNANDAEAEQSQHHHGAACQVGTRRGGIGFIIGVSHSGTT
jgi:hypothetical protein